MTLIPAPELIGDAWLSTGGRRLSIEDLRGRFVLLDFWTLCCVNCHHVLAELRPIEAQFHDVLTVVGVHSPKFEHEKRPETVASAIERHDIHHPVLNDPNMSTWQAYGVRAWPTLVLIDPEGNIVATYSGEGHGHALTATLERLVPEYEARGSLVRGADVYVAPEPGDSPFRQPGKVTVIPEPLRAAFNDSDLLVSNSGGHTLVAVSSDALDVPRAILGSGVRGRSDGFIPDAEFAEPYGVVFVDGPVANRLGVDLVVSDTANHLLRGINVTDGTVVTLAGTGAQWMGSDPTEGNAIDVPLSTPWDLAVLGDDIVIAMAGDHRIWAFSTVDRTVRVIAGTTNEGLVDAPNEAAWFAQPSAVEATAQRGGGVWVADSETSALRFVGRSATETVSGHGLFDFGHRDGTASEALFQHPLGLTELPDGSVLIADTYNGAVRRFDPATNSVSTIARDLSEPSDVVVVNTNGSAHLVVVEAAAHRLTRVPLDQSVVVEGEALRTVRPALHVAAGAATVEVVFSPPPGQKYDDRYGPSTALVVSSTPADLILSGAGRSVELVRDIVLNPEITEGVLHIAARGASCDSEDAGIEHATCHIHQQDWGIPVRISEGGESVVSLVLSGA